MKRTLAWVLTAASIGGALFVSSLPSMKGMASRARAYSPTSTTAGGAEPPASSNAGADRDNPEAIVWTMTDAWRAGDVRAYLDCFADPLRAKLQRTAEEMGEGKFAEFLKRTNNEVKGLAISGTTNRSDMEAEVPLEFVYRDKNETQTYVVRMANGVWRIVDLKGTARIRTLVPYGTEVYTPPK